ncbi:class I SAM-dependent RNA methyltransferase [Sulfuriroseicoccus oceanibius]|uniref:Class I SAM-dependent RNA methyltransferase n=1 Tax=Sulfuriroseicoccus oceanibius TaxID=2707525 RepID=A0A6B3LE41_9BACT|nr:class I SAM-dependent RNA methyltransferase [Sulfuriroseicoccus oceanibius]QQL45988.1 class I SAM-dependent RNA methyltransferase [Sulfuriroseicoccus oceanibius]
MPGSRPRVPAKFNPHPFAYHEEVELQIHSLTNLGVGVARHGEDQWVVFVPFALPGETVLARIFRNHKSYSEADLVRVIDPSPNRVEPVCPLFGTCGGCQYQNFKYSEQLVWKRRQVEELLQRMVGIEAEVQPVIASPKEYHYRSKLTPHFQKPRCGELSEIGFLKQGRRYDLVDVESCPIAMDQINERLIGVRADVRSRGSSFKRGATLLLRADKNTVHTESDAIAEEDVEGVTFRFKAGEFFQNNPYILPKFTSFVREQAAAGGNKYLIDAYCGSGLFGLTSARAFDQVAGIEVSEAAIDWAKANAKANGIENVRFINGSAEAIFQDVQFPGSETTVIIDPPRKGSNQMFIDQLQAFGPSRVVYVSCNPATQMRDLKEFLEIGYEIENVQPFDLFPQTRHLECIVTLRKA